MKNRIYLILAAVLLWTGFVGAISFMEAWLKFQAPGVTLPIGLSIGRLVFASLNKMEWFFCIVSVIILFFSHKDLRSGLMGGFSFLILILLLQTLWLLPALDQRAGLIIKGEDPGPSLLHVYFVAAEFFKVVTLLLVSHKLFRLALQLQTDGKEIILKQ